MNRPLQSSPGRQHGIAAVEFALTCVILFSVLFGVMEVARLSFVWNSLTQATNVTARGAAALPFKSADLDTLRVQAIFTASKATLMPLTDNIKYDNLLIDYLDANRNPIVTPPICQIDNLVNCATNPTANSCVRFVRVRLCQADSGSGNCGAVPYHPMFALPLMDGLKINMPQFTAIVPLEAQATPGKCN
jgi:Flp pilus assembly protein TadG